MGQDGLMWKQALGFALFGATVAIVTAALTQGSSQASATITLFSGGTTISGFAGESQWTWPIEAAVIGAVLGALTGLVLHLAGVRISGGRAQPAERTHYFPASTRGEREQTKREVYLSCGDNWVAERDPEVVRLLGSPIRKSAALRSCHPASHRLGVGSALVCHDACTTRRHSKRPSIDLISDRS
ncbi:hypothetical protein CBI33_21100 [Rhodococcus erythropolis]|nr:hypothetical protein CBI33_21100 [Rhodococcus erythropolis]